MRFDVYCNTRYKYYIHIYHFIDLILANYTMSIIAIKYYSSKALKYYNIKEIIY